MPTQFPPVLEITNLDDLIGYRLAGSDSQDEFGFSVSSAGDINGDGINDFMVAEMNSPETVYLVFGGNTAMRTLPGLVAGYGVILENPSCLVHADKILS